MSPTVAVVVPAYNAEATLPACLAAIAAMTRKADEVILFLDGATDRTEEIAIAAGVRIIRNEGKPKGPAHGRNIAAAAAASDLVLFVDADVVIAPDALELLVADMTAHGARGAFGSYDDRPQSLRATSLYANLRHHFVHQHSARDATTFWSGLGLIDRQLFLSMGGYDAEQYLHPSIEDVELGTRIVAAGHRIRLVPEAQGKHWKDWSLYRVWHTDIVRRAMPWSRLLADRKTEGADLNIVRAEQIKAGVALLVPACVLGGFFAAPFFYAAAAFALLYVWLNRRFFGFLAARLPTFSLIKAMAMHWCYHVYSTAVFVYVHVETWLGRRSPVAVPKGTPA